MTESAAILDPQQPVADEVRERLRAAARVAQSWHVVHRPNTASTFETRVRAARQALKVHEMTLAELQFRGESEDESQTLFRSAVHELRASPWLLRSAIAGISDSRRTIATIPRVVSPPQNEEPRVAAASE